jgi:chondroitin AC lyase
MMTVRHPNPRFAWATGLTLLAVVGGQPPVAEAGEAPIVVAASADPNTVRQRILEPLLAPVPAEAARKLLQAIQPDGSWPDIDYQDPNRSGWKTVRHLSNVATLARAYRSPGSKLHGDESLRGAILGSLDYWLSHDFQNSNWWWNQIGVPRSLLPTVLLVEKDLSAEQRSRALTILRRAKMGMTGQNLVWVTEITAVRGILENDPELVAAAYRRITDEIRRSTGEGIQPDFSFHQHGPCLYNHGYGAAFAGDCSEIATQVAGTRFAFPSEKIALLGSLILDGSQWMTRGNVTDFGGEGREIARRGQTANYLNTVARNMLQLPTGREAELRDLAARASGQPAPPLVGNRHFWRSDLMTHHRPGYYASARMFSSRIANTDMPCNGEGLKSHHIADGCNLLLRTGREFQDIFPVWDWQKIPGTTVEQHTELTGSPRRMGKTSFVGGVSNGEYGLAAFDLERDALAARKSWFFFDDEYACLGAGITCATDGPVVTTLNQCNLAGDVLVANDKRVRKLESKTHSLDAPDWLWHDGVGYVLLGPGAVRLHNGPQQGSWWEINREYSKDTIARDVFLAWIDHGPRPQNATYTYLVVPGIAADTLATYVGRSPVRILRNAPSLQAVWHERLRTAGLAFYEPGQVEIRRGLTVAVDKPCLVLLQESPEKLLISISNPRNEEATIQLEVSRSLAGDGVELLNGPGSCRITVALPNEMEAGKSVTRAYTAR